MLKKELEAKIEELEAQLAAKLAAQVQVPTVTAAAKKKKAVWNSAVLSAVSLMVAEAKGRTGRMQPVQVLKPKGLGELRATVIDLMQKKHQVVVSPTKAQLTKAVVSLVLSGRLVSNKAQKVLTKAQNKNRPSKYVICDVNAERYSQMFEMKYATK
jgi:cell division septum initiation protein DivIVA